MRRHSVLLILLCLGWMSGGFAAAAQAADQQPDQPARTRRPGFSEEFVAKCPECAALAAELVELRKRINALDDRRGELGDQHLRLQAEEEAEVQRYQDAMRAGDRDKATPHGQRAREILSERARSSQVIDAADRERYKLFDAMKAKERELFECEAKCFSGGGGSGGTGTTGGTGGFKVPQVMPIPHSPGARCVACQDLADQLGGVHQVQVVLQKQRVERSRQRDKFYEEVRQHAARHAELQRQGGAGTTTPQLRAVENDWRQAGARMHAADVEIEAIYNVLIRLEQDETRLQQALADCNSRRCATTTDDPNPTGDVGTGGSTRRRRGRRNDMSWLRRHRGSHR